MTTVAILGAGELGGSIAHALARGEAVSRVLLIDDAAGVAAGKALDIQQACAIDGTRTQLSGTDDMDRVIGSAVCMIADRAGQGEWHKEEALLQLSQMAQAAGTAPLVFAGASQAGLLLRLGTEGGVRRERLLGSCPEAYGSAVRAMVAMEARCSPREVMLTVLGAPPAFVIPWSEASIGGYALERTLTTVQLARIEARVARLWPPGAYTLGLAAARLAEAVLTSSRRAFSVLTLLGGEFGVRNRVGALPVLLAAGGVAHIRVPTLSTRERVQLDTALGV